jgi:hypothetical protein
MSTWRGTRWLTGLPTAAAPQAFKAGSKAGRSQRKIMYLLEQTGAAVEASEPWTIDNLKYHVLALATAAYDQASRAPVDSKSGTC